MSEFRSTARPFVIHLRRLILRAVRPASLVVLVVLCAVPGASYAAPEMTRDQAVANWIFRISGAIEWPESQSRKAMRLVVFSESPRRMSEELKGFANDYRIHGLPVEIRECSAAERLPDCEVVFVARDQVNAVRDLMMRLEGRPVLVISEDYENRRLVMVNLVSKDRKTLQFEVNKANVLNQGLKPRPNLLLLGGTELDVAKLYKEGQESLVKLNDEMAQRQAKVDSEMKRLNGQIADSRALLAKSTTEYEETLKKLKDREDAYAQLKAKADKELDVAREQARQARELAVQNEKQSADALAQLAGFESERRRRNAQMEQELTESRAKIKEISDDIEKSTEKLRRQNEQIEAQTKTLETQKSKLEIQTQFLLLLGVSVVGGIVGIFFIVRFNRSLARQRLVVSEQNEKLREAQASLVAAREAADAANLAKSRFLANMSHELRTPLNAILGYSQLMIRDVPKESESAESLKVINRAGAHLLSLINEVLDLAKIESHKYVLEPVTFDLGEFTREIIDLFRQRAADKGLEIYFDQTSSFPRFICADRAKLRQVLINVAGNALKFTKVGHVAIRLSTLGPSPGAGGCTLLFEVTDTGPGIHPDDLERIFIPFAQAAHRPDVEGTGLGLALSLAYVKLMGGDFTVTSDFGHGSTFKFSIHGEYVDEATAESITTPKLESITALSGADKCRVLIVEDQPENRLLLRKMLTRYGFAPTEAVNGLEGLEAARRELPDLVLLDRRMPQMDGLAAAKELRKLPGAERMRIIAVTAQAYKEDEKEMRDAGCDDFLRKPYLEGELLELLAKYLPVTVVRETPATTPPSDRARESEENAALLQELRALPAADLAGLREACRVFDIAYAEEFLKTHPRFAPLIKPMIQDFRLDLLAALLSG